MYKGRIVLAKGSSRIPLVLKEFHDSAAGAHLGFFRTYKRISALFYWEGMKKDIQGHVQACETCQWNKYETLSLGRLLQPLPILATTWTDLSMDFLGRLPKVKGLDAILVVVDRFTKYTHFLALSHPFTTKQVTELFIREVVRLHGFCQTIVTNRDRLFDNSL